MSLEMVFKVAMTLVMIVLCLWGIKWLWTTQIDPVATLTRMAKKPFEAPSWVATRDPKKIYQDGVAVRDVTGDVKETSEKVLFAQLANTGQLKRGLPIEYQRHRLRIVKVGASIGMKSVVLLIRFTPNHTAGRRSWARGASRDPEAFGRPPSGSGGG